jgi:hypothetical protein
VASGKRNRGRSRSWRRVKAREQATPQARSCPGQDEGHRSRRLHVRARPGPNTWPQLGSRSEADLITREAAVPRGMSAPPYPQRSPTHHWGSAVRPFRRCWSSTDPVAARCLLFHSDDLRGGPHGRARGRAIGPRSALGHISGRTAARRRGAHGSRAHALVAARSPCFAWHRAEGGEGEGGGWVGSRGRGWGTRRAGRTGRGLARLARRAV